MWSPWVRSPRRCAPRRQGFRTCRESTLRAADSAPRTGDARSRTRMHRCCRGTRGGDGVPGPRLPGGDRERSPDLGGHPVHFLGVLRDLHVLARATDRSRRFGGIGPCRGHGRPRSRPSMGWDPRMTRMMLLVGVLLFVALLVLTLFALLA